MPADQPDQPDSSLNPRGNKYVTLVSSDGFEFVVLREAALISPTIKAAVGGHFIEAKTGRCSFNEISGVVLEKVAEYLLYHHKNRDVDNVPDMHIPVEIVLQLLAAADYLGLDSRPPPKDRVAA